MINSKNTAKKLIKDLEIIGDPKKVAENLFDFLERNHLTKILPNILKNLENLYVKKEENEVTTLFCPHEPSEKLISEAHAIANKSKSKMKVKIVEGLLGGAIIRSGYTLSNLSLKNNVESLRKSLIK